MPSTLGPTLRVDSDVRSSRRAGPGHDSPIGGIESRHANGANSNPAGPNNNMSSRIQLIVTAVAALFVAACGKQQAAPQFPPPEVGVVVVHAKSVPLVREASGRLAPTRASDVRARVPGVLQKRLYKEGSMVKEGQLLMLIDPAPYRAALAVATANLEQAQASATNAQVTATRNRELAKQSLVSRKDLDDSEALERSSRRGGVGRQGAGADRAHQPELRQCDRADFRARQPVARARGRAGGAGRGDAANYHRAGRSHLRLFRSAGVGFRAAAARAGRWAGHDLRRTQGRGARAARRWHATIRRWARWTSPTSV